MNLYYLPVDSIAGAAVQFPLGPVFKRGGKLVAIGTWTLDAGSGPDDYLVAVTSKGEMCVYKGTDPSSATTWSIVGTYDVGEPVGNRPFQDFGGDLLYLSRMGLFPVSKYVQSPVINISSTISFKIDGAFLEATDSYLNNYGWQILNYKTHNMLIVNLPVTTGQLAYQYVMNTITGSWCRFTGWNATNWAMWQGELYFGGGLVVDKAWSGVSDKGIPITGTIIQAYQPIGTKQQKSISLVRPNIASSAALTLTMALDTDFKTFSGSTMLTYSPLLGGGLWDTGVWDTALWDSGSALIEPTWTTVPNNPGYLHAFRMQVTTSVSTFTWTSNNYVIRRAGIL